MTREVRNFFAGGGAGMTAVMATYPLDLARARMALLIEQGGVEVPSMLGTMRGVYANEGGVRALYSGAGVSLTGLSGDLLRRKVRVLRHLEEACAGSTCCQTQTSPPARSTAPSAAASRASSRRRSCIPSTC
ncbi:unnamed protein product [Prorocentrum cordatum]|uniref:ADP,ATP carrier protein n=1 Tax=Prorocentrum cordatum TaxID=2364126 RepID=A0ABN9VK23_9DINO|nr:unnamed protein product [Polarella glacialis]